MNYNNTTTTNNNNPCILLTVPFLLFSKHMKTFASNAWTESSKSEQLWLLPIKTNTKAAVNIV